MTIGNLTNCWITYIISVIERRTLMATLKVTKVFPDGTKEEVILPEKKAPRRKSRASKNNKKKQEQSSLEEVKEED